MKKLLCIWFLVQVTLSALALNVASYGAVGDAVRCYVNTVSNSVIVTTTNQLSSADIGKAIEVFGAGIPTSTINNQDLVTTISNVVSGTNIYLTQKCQQTLTNAFTTYGHDNRTNFENCIAAAGPGSTTITIPAGVYLLLPTAHAGSYGYGSIYLTKGGLDFVGAGTNSTVLLGQGAWTIQPDASAWRGFLIQIWSPITNNFPVSFSYLTLDGGVTNGFTSNHNFPASTVDGSGWDETHDAVLASGNASTSINQYWFTNVLVTHWRGEEFKSVDGSTNGRIGIYNSRFTDGNATALNIYPAWDVQSNQFDNLEQIAEYYQQYAIYPGNFSYNNCYAIANNGFAVNGGRVDAPTFSIIGNTMTPATGWNAFMFLPACNIVVSSNTLNCFDYSSAFVTLPEGTQGTADCTNIVISYNTINNPYNVLILGGGDINSQNNKNIQVFGNTFLNPNQSVTLLQDYGWSTNVNFYKNDGSTIDHFGISSGAYNSQFVFLNTNNAIYGFPLFDNPDKPTPTNGVGYGNGSRYHVLSAAANSVFFIDDAQASLIPAGAQIIIEPTLGNNLPYTNQAPPLYLNRACTGPPIILANGTPVVLNWNQALSVWQTNAVSGGGGGGGTTPLYYPAFNQVKF